VNRIARAVAAARARAAFPCRAVTNVRRLVDGSADECPDLVVDQYGAVLRVEHYSADVPADADALGQALVDAAGASGLVQLLRPPRGKARLLGHDGAVPRAHVVHEAGMRLLVRTREDDAPGTGVFVDHRDGRALVRARARGAVVLNLFAHAGAFGVAAAVGGAARVDHVDAARKCAPWAALNLALNGIDPRQHRFLVDDALEVLARAARRAPAYDVIVCDPPTTAIRKDGSRFIVGEALVGLAEQAARALRPGGSLLLSMNDRKIDVDGVCAAAALGAGRAARVESVVPVSVPADVTSRAVPSERPMRGAWLTVAKS
jgi:23S rRNA (cytosine1962-C5)-methyltransferase